MTRVPGRYDCQGNLLGKVRFRFVSVQGYCRLRLNDLFFDLMDSNSACLPLHHLLITLEIRPQTESAILGLCYFDARCANNDRIDVPCINSQALFLPCCCKLPQVDSTLALSLAGLACSPDQRGTRPMTCTVGLGGPTFAALLHRPARTCKSLQDGGWVPMARSRPHV